MHTLLLLIVIQDDGASVSAQFSTDLLIDCAPSARVRGQGVGLPLLHSRPQEEGSFRQQGHAADSRQQHKTI